MPASAAYPSLERVPGKQNWVDKAGGLPSYIERIAKHLHYEKGHSISTAIAMAVNTTKKWCSTGRNHNGGKLSAKTKGLACKAVGSWEAKKGKSKARDIAEAVRSGIVMTPEERTELANQLAGRLTLCEGMVLSLKGGRDAAVQNTRALLEATDVGGRQSIPLIVGGDRAELEEVIQVRERLDAETEMLSALVEALGGRRGQKKPMPPKQANGTPPGKNDPSRVGALQRRLHSIGHELKDDGRFGNKTHDEVKSFQRNAKLKPDGVVGPKTTEALRTAPTPEEMEAMEDELAAASTPEGQPDAPGEGEAPKKPPKMPAVLSKGVGVGTGPNKAVEHVQSQLVAVGQNVEEDGHFGPQTDGAVKRFQRKWGLKSDGLVGPKTQRTLHGAAAKVNELREAVAERQRACAARDSWSFTRARARESALRSELAEADTRTEHEGGHKLKCPKCDHVNKAAAKNCSNCNHDLTEARKAKFAKLREASARGSARKVIQLKRLPDGTFAPKGQGQVLRAGEKVTVPHKSGKGTVKGVVTNPSAGEGRHYRHSADDFGVTHPVAKVRLESGPDSGQEMDVLHGEGEKKIPKPPQAPGDGKEHGVFKRTFEAKKHPEGSAERKKLNADSRTSEYQTSHKYTVVTPVGTSSYKSKAEADAAWERAPKQPKPPQSLGTGKVADALGAASSVSGAPPLKPDAAKKKGSFAGEMRARLKQRYEGMSTDEIRAFLDMPDTAGIGGEAFAAARRELERRGESPKRKKSGKVAGGLGAVSSLNAPPLKADAPKPKPPQSPGTFPKPEDRGEVPEPAPEGTSDKVIPGPPRREVAKAGREGLAKPPPQAPGTGGMQPNSENLSLKDMPLGTTIQMNDGQQFILHKAVGDPWMIMKPVDGGKAKPIHKMLAPPQLDTSTAYEPETAYPDQPDLDDELAQQTGASPKKPSGQDSMVGTTDDDLFDTLKQSVAAAKEGKLGAKAKKGVTAPSKPSPPGGSSFEKHSDIGDSPGRGPTGKVRNFKAMGQQKLAGVITELEQYGDDPEALDAAKAAAAGKGFKVKPSAPGAKPKKPKGDEQDLGTAPATGNTVKTNQMGDLYQVPPEKGATPKQPKAEGGDLADAVQKVPAGGYWALDKDIAGGQALETLDAATPEERRRAFKGVESADLARLYLTAEDANFHTMNKDVEAELTERGISYPEYEALSTSGSGKAAKPDATNAALDAYKAAGGDDPEVIAMLKKKAK